MSKPENIGAVRCDCTNCEYSILDNKWGDLKCKKLHRRIIYPCSSVCICEHYKKKVEKNK